VTNRTSKNKIRFQFQFREPDASGPFSHTDIFVHFFCIFLCQEVAHSGKEHATPNAQVGIKSLRIASARHQFSPALVSSWKPEPRKKEKKKNAFLRVSSFARRGFEPGVSLAATSDADLESVRDGCREWPEALGRTLEKGFA
jgi:hypothetical protein